MAKKTELDFSRFFDKNKVQEVITPERQVELDFAQLLEMNGYVGALRLIDEEIKPFAKEKGLSLFDAAWKYANSNEEQDTSWYQLYLVLVNLPGWIHRGISHHKQNNGSENKKAATLTT